MHIKVPFYPNTEDNTHCVQAALRMVLKHFFPEREFTYEELDRASNKQSGKWTWPYAAIVWMTEQGLEVINVSIFDTNQFVAHAESYMLEVFGEEKTKANLEHSDISLAVSDAEQYLKNRSIKEERRIPTIDDIKEFLKQGYIPTCGVNSRVINGEEGYAGHRIVVTGFDENGLFIHDPGGRLPPIEDRLVDYQTFERAWGYPDEKQKGVIAYRLGA